MNNRNKMQTASKVVPASVPKAFEEIKELYVGNVNPRCSVHDMKQHLTKHDVNVPLSDITKLRKSDDYSSFCISLPLEKYNTLSVPPAKGIWAKGLKVRPFAPKGRPKKQSPPRQKKRQDNRKNDTVQPPQNVSYSSNRIPDLTFHDQQHGLRTASFQAGYEMAMQDARHQSFPTAREYPNRLHRPNFSSGRVDIPMCFRTQQHWQSPWPTY